MTTTISYTYTFCVAGICGCLGHIKKAGMFRMTGVSVVHDKQIISTYNSCM